MVWDRADRGKQETVLHLSLIHIWQELSDFVRNLLNASLKDNPYLERGLMTGITRVSKESIFSDLNHLKVVTTTSDQYADCFGFTEREVRDALEEYGLADRMEEMCIRDRPKRL